MTDYGSNGDNTRDDGGEAEADRRVAVRMTAAANLAELNARNVDAETLHAWRDGTDPEVSAIASAELRRRTEPAPVVLFRQYGTDRYAEAFTVAEASAAGLTDRCAECGADLTGGQTPEALFQYPPAVPEILTRPTAYACPTCLACAPIVAERIARNVAELDDPSTYTEPAGPSLAQVIAREPV